MQEADIKMKSKREGREEGKKHVSVAESACSDSRSVGPKCPSVDLLIGRDWARWRAPAPHAGGRKARREVVTEQGGAWSTAARVILHS